MFTHVCICLQMFAFLLWSQLWQPPCVYVVFPLILFLEFLQDLFLQVESCKHALNKRIVPQYVYHFCDHFRVCLRFIVRECGSCILRLRFLRAANWRNKTIFNCDINFWFTGENKLRLKALKKLGNTIRQASRMAKKKHVCLCRCAMGWSFFPKVLPPIDHYSDTALGNLHMSEWLEQKGMMWSSLQDVNRTAHIESRYSNFKVHCKSCWRKHRFLAAILEKGLCNACRKKWHGDFRENMTWYTYIYIYTHTFTGRVCLDFVSMSATDYTIQQGGPPIGKFFNHAVCYLGFG